MLVNNNKYLETIESIKQEIANARYKATASVNKKLIILYYNIGKIINNHKTWGNKFIKSLLTDIALEFPNSKGYSVRNLKYMAKFAELYPDEEFVQQVVVQIPWGHNIVLMDKFDDENIILRNLLKMLLFKMSQIFCLNSVPYLLLVVISII